MANFLRPGVYIDEINSLPPSVIPIETAIPVFIGYTDVSSDPSITREELHLKPRKIYSMLDYQRFFGKADPEKKAISVKVKKDQNDQVIREGVFATVNEASRSPHLMYYALQAYFFNGGGPCWIVSVGSYTGSVALGNELGDGTNDGLLTGLVKAETIDEITILVFPEGSRLDAGERQALYNRALDQCEKKKNRFLIADVLPANPTNDLGTIKKIAENFRNNLIGFNNLKYGAAYAPDLNTIFDYAFDDTAVEVAITKESSTDPVKVMLADLKTPDELALYNLIVSKIRSIPLLLPPGPIMAGIYVQVDQARGVFKAPANVGLNGVIAPSMKISDAEHDLLNMDTSGKSINAIRSFAGRGVLVFGARTLAGNDNEWRYISVRRFFNFAELSIKNTIEQFLFEPNDTNTWERVKAMIANFLTTQWQQGALVGNRPEQAFFVNVGLGSTMTAVDIQEGRMNVDVGMAVVRPAEFIVLKFSHLMQIS